MLSKEDILAIYKGLYTLKTALISQGTVTECDLYNARYELGSLKRVKMLNKPISEWLKSISDDGIYKLFDDIIDEINRRKNKESEGNK